MRLPQTSRQPFGSEVCQGTPTPLRSGWREDSDHFAFDWMRGDPVPTAVLELLSCLANGLKCTDVCKLDCDNRFKDSSEEIVSDNSDEDEEM